MTVGRWFTVEYRARGEWHLYDGRFARLSDARRSVSDCRDHDHEQMRIVEHRVRP